MSPEKIEEESNMHGCCRRNGLPVCLTIVIIILVTVLAGVGFLFLGSLHYSTSECVTAACIKSSAEIRKYIDETVSPCEDFYSFVCGKFEKVAYEEQINNLLSAERNKVQRRLDSFVVDSVSPDDHDLVKMQKLYFQNCLNEEDIDEDHNQSFFKKLVEIGPWPFVNSSTWDGKNFHWVEVMTKARKLGLPFEWFLKFDLYEKDNVYELKISRPDNCNVNISKEYLELQSTILENLKLFTTNKLFEFHKLKTFQAKLNALCMNVSDDDCSLKRKDKYKWEASGFLESLPISPHRLNFFLIYNINYIQGLNRLLRNTTETDQARYILWKIVEQFAPYLNKPVREKYAEYITKTGGGESRFQFCLDDTKSKFKYLSAIANLQSYATSSLREDGEELVTFLGDEISNFIESVVWKNDQVKETHLDFYQNLEKIIGGTDDMFNDHFLNLYYSGVTKMDFFSGNIIDSVTDWSQTTFLSKLKMVGQSVTHNLESIHEANSQFVAVLNKNKHQLVLPAAAFNSFLYDKDRPKYLNFAGLGSIIAEELIKSMELLTSYKNETYIGFEDSKECFIENLETSNKTLNLWYKNYEHLLAQELAYHAYQSYVKNTGEETPLIGLDYTPNQMFWIRAGLNWCYHSLPEEEDYPEMQELFKYRITESVKNSDYFAADFNCLSEAPMNPTNKCTLL